MNKLMIAFIVLVVGINNVSANEWDSLKSKPVNQYQLAQLYLTLGTTIMTLEQKGREVPNTNFRLYSFSVIESDGKLGMKMSLVGRSKDLDAKLCSGLVDRLQKNLLSSIGGLETIIPFLKASEVDSLKNDFLIEVQFISKENKELTIQC